MLIRSQDKTIIVNMEAISKIFIRDKTRICVSYITDGMSCIGEYGSEEECISVLDALQEECVLSTETSYYYKPTRVYEMHEKTFVC